MGNFVKWIGGILGWVFGGPVGGVLGFIGGAIFDSLEIDLFRKRKDLVVMGNFSENLLVLIAAILNADGNKLKKSELDYVKKFLKNNYGEKEALKALNSLRELLKRNIQVGKICEYIRLNLDYASRLQFSHFLYNLAIIDGHVTTAEQNMLNIINRGLGLAISDKGSVGATATQEESIIAAYGILGVQRSTGIIDIKKAYRNLAIKYHPDKVAYLGDELRKDANEKFQQLTRAYEIIKKDKRFT